jgi:biotin operon repressor
VFPSVNYIAEVLGIGLTATKKAINDLISEGLIIKTKRDKIRGNYNKYLLTPKVQISTSEPSQNECFKKSDINLSITTNKTEKIKEPIGVDDYKILKDYAIKHNARNINAYINALKQSGSAEKILREHKLVSERYYTGEVERIEAIKREVIQKPPQEYFDNIRKRFGLTPSAPLKGGTGLCI